MKVMLDYFAYYGGNGNTKADPKGRAAYVQWKNVTL